MDGTLSTVLHKCKIKIQNLPPICHYITVVPHSASSPSLVMLAPWGQPASAVYQLCLRLLQLFWPASSNESLATYHSQNCVIGGRWSDSCFLLVTSQVKRQTSDLLTSKKSCLRSRGLSVLDFDKPPCKARPCYLLVLQNTMLSHFSDSNITKH